MVFPKIKDQQDKRTRVVTNSSEHLHAPLLQSYNEPSRFQHHQHVQHQHQECTASPELKPSAAAGKPDPVDLGWTFVRRTWRILVLIKAAPALCLMVLAILEAIIISRIGTISSAFYKVFVDGQQNEVLHLMAWSGSCYVATALFFTVKSALQDYFAWRWRARLTLHMQQLYCSNMAFYSLKGVDNPDQRLAQDLPLLMSSLAETLAVLAAAPFNVVWYTMLTYQVFGSWLPVAAAYAFFALGLLVQQLVMQPVATMVYKQEAAEGSYRYRQMRVRAWAEEVAMYRSAPVEQQHLELGLAQVLACQGRLLLRRALLTAATKFLEYFGLVVNFSCLAYAVFSGAWEAERSTAGGVAAKVSVASFYLLTLIYSFTQVLDLASKVSNLAGLTARVSQLLEQLQSIHHTHSTLQAVQESRHCRDQTTKQQQQQQQQRQQQQQNSSPLPQLLSKQSGYSEEECGSEGSSEDECQGDAQQQQGRRRRQRQRSQQLLLVGDGTAPSHKRYASQAVTLQQPQLYLLSIADLGTANDQQQQQQQQQDEVTALDQLPDHVEQLSDVGETLTLQQQSQHQQLQAVPNQIQQQQQQQQRITPGQIEQQLMQISVHSLGADLLMHEVRRAFPDSPRLAPLTAVVTMQFCGAARQVMMQHWRQPPQQQQVLRAYTPEGLTVSHDVAHNQQPLLGRAASAPLPNNSSALAAAAAAAGTTSRQRQRSDVMPPSAAAAAAGAVRCPCGGASSAAAAGSSACTCCCSSSEMETQLQLFLAWQDKVCRMLTARGYWADALDPRTGRAMHGSAGSAYDEVIGAQVLLGYATRQGPGGLALTQHPEAGTQVYPATLFTSAPLPAVKDALKAAAAASAAATAPQTAAAAAAAQHAPTLDVLNAAPVESMTTGSSSSSTAQQQQLLPQPASISAASSSSSSAASVAMQAPTVAAAAATAAEYKPLRGLGSSSELLLLSCVGLSVSTPSGVPIVRDLTLTLAAAAAASWPPVASLLIRGPSGCGKSTLLKCLAGLGQADKGRFSIPAAAAAAAGTGNVLGGHAPSCTAAAAAAAAGFRGVMFVPQRMLAAPGQTLRAQLAYPAAEAMFACCCCTDSNESGSTGSSITCGSSQLKCRNVDQGDYLITIQGNLRSSKQQQQQQGCRQPWPAAVWWNDWLSCGIKRRSRQQQQQQFEQLSFQDSVKHSTAWSRPNKPYRLAAAAVDDPAAAGRYACSICPVLHAVLQQVGLAYLLAVLPHGLDTAAEDWGVVLSAGEMQRLGFARVLLHRPVLAVLDEATSSLPADVAVDLYRQLRRAGVSYVSVGHSSSLLAVHEQVLSVKGDGTGSWELEHAPQNANLMG